MTSFGTGTFGGPDLAPLPTDTPLSVFRSMVAAVLDTNPDVAVHADMVDSVTPPAYLLVWPDQNLTTQTACYYRVRLQVVCVGARIDAGPGYDQVEALVASAVVQFGAAGLAFEPVGAYGPLQVGGVTYLSARLIVSGTVSLEQENP
jgi:hypothetical protein